MNCRPGLSDFVLAVALAIVFWVLTRPIELKSQRRGAVRR